MKNILVTGITGRTGEYFLNELRNNSQDIKEYHFRFLVRATSDTSLLDSTSNSINAEKFIGDKDNIDDLESFCTGNFDTLLHIYNIRDSERLVSIALKHNVKRFILVHTTGIYSKYKSAGQLYREIDKRVIAMITNAGASYTILRPTMIYGGLNDGNISTFIKMVDKIKYFPVINGGLYYLQPVHRADLGKAYYSVLISPESTHNKCYNLSGNDKIYLIDLFKEMAIQLGTKNTFFSIPYWIAFAGAWFLYVITLGKIDLKEKVQRMTEDRAYDHDDASADFNYSPISIRDGIKEEVDLYLNRNIK